MLSTNIYIRWFQGSTLSAADSMLSASMNMRWSQGNILSAANANACQQTSI